MMKKILLDDDIKCIMAIIEKGRYHKRSTSEYDGCREEVTFFGLIEYMKRKEALNKSFKLKHFIKPDDSTINSKWMVYRPFYDNPMRTGHIRTAIKYGINKGYIEKRSESSTRRLLIDKIKEDGLL